jgi:hypothetical protein
MSPLYLAQRVVARAIRRWSWRLVVVPLFLAFAAGGLFAAGVAGSPIHFTSAAADGTTAPDASAAAASGPATSLLDSICAKYRQEQHADRCEYSRYGTFTGPDGSRLESYALRVEASGKAALLSYTIYFDSSGKPVRVE